MKALSLFTGAGGLDLGLEAAGYENVGCVEKDEVTRGTLAANRDWQLLRPVNVEGFARTVSPGDLGLRRGELTLLAGGPPCQPFSGAARWARDAWRGMDDVRAVGFQGFLAAIDSFLPTAVMIENVPGFVTGSRSAISALQSALEQINSAHRTADYRLSWRIVDAADHGVPQRRKRAIAVALRSGEEFNWPAESHRDRPVRAYDALRDLRVDHPPVASGRWAGILPSIPEGRNYLWHTPKGGGEPLFGYRTKYWSFLLKLAKDRTSWTLPANPGPATGPFHWDSRPLSVKELLRLQTFPASWKLCGSRRDQVRQVGNATPPLLAEVFARAISKQVCERSYDKPPKYRIPRARVLPEPEPMAPLPEKYLVLRGDHKPHPGTGLGPAPRSD